MTAALMPVGARGRGRGRGKAPNDTLLERAARRDEREMGERYRVCATCTKGDRILGKITSILKCQRCGKRPCVGFVIILDG